MPPAVFYVLDPPNMGAALENEPFCALCVINPRQLFQRHILHVPLYHQIITVCEALLTCEEMVHFFPPVPQRVYKGTSLNLSHCL